MVSRKYLWTAVLAVVAGFAFISCEKEEKTDDNTTTPTLSLIAANDTFSDEGKAAVQVVLAGEATKDVTATIAIGTEAQTGFTAVAADAITVDSNVTIAQGERSATVNVSVDLSKVASGQQAVLTLASASGASVNAEAATAYIKVPDPAAPSLDGADVWSIIGAFNEWAGDVDLTKIAEVPETWAVTGVKLGGEFKFRGNHTWGDFDLGTSSTVVLGEPLDLVVKGGNITVEEGTYDIVLFPVQQKAVISVATNPQGGASNLDWTVKYTGRAWVEGLYAEGELETFEVSNTDKEKFYHILLVDLAEEADLAELIAADAKGFFDDLQQDIEDSIQSEMDWYDETREEAIPELFYNEENDGTQVLTYGLPQGNYIFAVLSMDANGILDGGYALVYFTTDSDPASYYDWGKNYTQNSDWGVEWDGWVEGYEGDYYWVAGNAAGAAYVAVDSYTDDELDFYYDGKLEDMFNYTQSNLKDYMYAGYTIEELAGYGLVTEVDTDGSFYDYLNTYDVVGETNIYIIGFDAEGNILADYGKSVVEIPEYVPDSIDWTERTDWAINYDATVDTGEADYPQAIVTTACDAEYYIMSAYYGGALEQYGIDVIGEDATANIIKYVGWGYTMDDLVGYQVVFDSVPAFSAWSGLSNGVEAYIFGFDADGQPTGEWHMEVIEGIEEEPVEPIEMTLVNDWSVALVGEPYMDGYYLMIDVNVNAPDIKYYLCEENTQEDLDYYYDGSVMNLALGYQDDIVKMVEAGYSMDEILWSNNDPETSIDVYNPGLETTIYIVEYDETGHATGRYGATVVNMPEEPLAAPAAVRKPAKAMKAKANVQPKQAQVTLGKKVRKGAPAFNVNSHSIKADAKAAKTHKAHKLSKATL